MLRFFKKYKNAEAKNLLVIGAPKSGTTALLYKLKNALGGNDVAEYFEPSHLETINKAITKNKKSITKVVAIKQIDMQAISNFSKIILIPRDPRDQFISAMLYEAGYHSLWDKDEELILEFYSALCQKSKQPDSINCIDMWVKYVGHSLPLNEFVQRNEYLRSFYKESNAFVLKYEDFIKQDFEKTEKYLDLSLNSGEIAVVPTRFNRVVRTKGTGSWKDWLTAADLEFFKDKFSNYYRDFGYTHLDWELDHNKIDKEFSSNYFLKTVNEKRKQEGLCEIIPL
ncbi:sulfotransferase domain-containing protein [Winogradskyella aurantia]|uniref:Sulfotransferase domain-containing protein n=1 Tax=Winogradskyella aurantia TaxID=1915063 RepID=A0A265UVK6_9FLAO|nr:sulfotransferase domain-containing protein [Winogradskyella aurantia]OZV69242.1 hypothetical protein CA834_07235 [Winogradskyella aurantia]